MQWTVEPIDMFFVVQSIVVPAVIVLVAPILLRRISSHRAVARSWQLWAAAVCYGVSWYLPSFLIGGENTAFSTHFIGGGVFSALLWSYACQQMHWRLSWLSDLVAVYAVVSSLGVANELFELLLQQTIMPSFSSSDTWWDLLANTTGALAAWVTLRFFAMTKIR